MQNMEELETNIIKIIKTYEINSNTASFDILPWIIFFCALIVIVTYLIKIEIHSNGKNWDKNKCSSKYLFFSGFMKSEGKNPLNQTLVNFKECIQRFS
jgi:hypothetical protein